MRPLKIVRRVVRFFNGERAIGIAVMVIIAWQLLLPPILGVADNGDFARLMVHFNLVHAPGDRADQYFAFVDRHYVINAVEARKYARPEFFSSELAFVATAFAISRIFSNTSFDLVWLGAVHVAALGAAISFLLLSTRAFASRMRTIGFVLGSIAFTDVAYIAYFNSFYSESATVLFLLIVAACAYGAITSDRRRMAWLVGYFAAATAFVLAKYQNVVLLPVLVFFGGLVVKRWGETRFFQAYVLIALAACYGGYLYFTSAPEAIDDAVLYNSVFDGILVGSPTPAGDLAALGLDRGLVPYAGSTAFQPDSLRFNPEFLQKFRQSVTIGGISRFYLARPGRLFAALNRSLTFAFQLRPKLGNYEKVEGRPPLSLSRSWAMWSTLRSAILPRNLWFVIAIAMLYLGLLSRNWLRDKDRLARLNLEWSALIPVMALAQLFAITVSDGISDLIKHAYLFNLLTDYMLVVMLTYLLTWFFGISKKQEAGETA